MFTNIINSYAIRHSNNSAADAILNTPLPAFEVSEGRGGKVVMNFRNVSQLRQFGEALAQYAHFKEGWEARLMSRADFAALGWQYHRLTYRLFDRIANRLYVCSWTRVNRGDAESPFRPTVWEIKLDGEGNPVMKEHFHTDPDGLLGRHMKAECWETKLSKNVYQAANPDGWQGVRVWTWMHILALMLCGHKLKVTTADVPVTHIMIGYHKALWNVAGLPLKQFPFHLSQFRLDGAGLAIIWHSAGKEMSEAASFATREAVEIVKSAVTMYHVRQSALETVSE